MTVTYAVRPAGSVPLPLALMFPLVPVTLHSAGPPVAVTVAEQRSVPSIRQPDTDSVPGRCGGGGDGVAVRRVDAGAGGLLGRETDVRLFLVPPW
ncbi:hypothetical protein, partial [Actinoallomurus acaciae]